MERLTRHWGENYVATELDYCSLLDIPKEDFLHFQDIVKKLATYEDAEEQGLLLRLPCKVGDPWYNIVSRCEAEEVPKDFECKIKCNDCQYKKERTLYEHKMSKGLLITLISGCDERYILGKTVFLTREEAEKALAEMG